MKSFHYACKSESLTYRHFSFWASGNLNVIKDVPYCEHCKEYIEEYDIIRPSMRLENFGHLKGGK
jgi:hypothetical protein